MHIRPRDLDLVRGGALGLPEVDAIPRLIYLSDLVPRIHRYDIHALDTAVTRSLTTGAETVCDTGT